MTLDRPVAIVTGASSGIGRAIASSLDAAALRVFGSFHPDESPPEVGGMTFLALDVDDSASVAAFVAHVDGAAGRLDVLVNCAGFGIAGALEDTSIDEAKAQFETNYFGVHRMCRAVLPRMRQQRSGKIVTVSSIGGLIALPFQSSYAASKFALEGLMEALRHEVRPFGVAVSLVEPADFSTGFTARRRIAADAGSPDSAYRDSFAAAMDVITEDETGGDEPAAVGRLVARIVATRRPRLRYTVGRADERLAVGLKRILPNRLFEPLVRRHYMP